MDPETLSKIRETIRRHRLIEPEMHIAVGLSGGPDSVCLFHALTMLQQELRFSLWAVHVNHRFRPGAAEADEAWVADFCKTHGVTLFSYAEDVSALAVQWGMSGEEAGRKVRYEAFGRACEAIARSTGACADQIRIAVAQNRNDQAETVLFRILRGTGTDGLAAMLYLRTTKAGFSVIRPLLDISRDEIETWCSASGLEPRRDHTNDELLYSRNRIRLELLPFLEQQFNPAVADALIRLSVSAAEDRAWFEDRSEDFLRQQNCPAEAASLELALKPLLELHPALRRRVLIKALKRIGVSRDIAFVHLQQAERLLTTGAPGKITEFPGGYRIRKKYHVAEFLSPDCATDLPEPASEPEVVISLRDLPAKPEQIVRMRQICLRIQLISDSKWVQIKKDSADQLLLDYEKLLEKGEDLSVRTRKAGDRLSPRGMQGSKKLQDFFTDEKIERQLRERIPLLAAGSEILWVIGYRKTERYRPSNQAKEVILLEKYTEM